MLGGREAPASWRLARRQPPTPGDLLRSQRSPATEAEPSQMSVRTVERLLKLGDSPAANAAVIDLATAVGTPTDRHQRAPRRGSLARNLRLT
ncbi:MAG: hypothetical protein GY788_03680 [bacterium]|nr:hypothetical protein [bacterium]